MEQPAIEFRAVAKRFRGVRGAETIAVADVDLTVESGSIVVLLGPSGCGKSTLLRLAAGLDRPTSGQVTITGNPVSGPRSDVGVVFQRPVLLPWRTAIGNVRLPSEVNGTSSRATTARAAHLLDQVGLHGFRDAYPGELSGGMQARVSLARALSQDPATLLMDEPFAALDALTREDLASLFLRLWEDQRRTVLFVTHSIDEAILLADRVAILSPRPGRIVRTIDVALPRPRAADLLSGPAAMGFAASIRDALRARSD